MTCILCVMLFGSASGAFASQDENNMIIDRVRAGDKLNIIVQKEEDLTRLFTPYSIGYEVNGKGELVFPLIGKIQAAGMSLEELRGVLEERLAEDYLVEPHVEVYYFRTDDAETANSVSALGAVKNTGVYAYYSEMKLTDLISTAGGFSLVKSDDRGNRMNSPATESVQVARRLPDGKRRVSVVNVDDIYSGQRTDIPLEVGDIVIVPWKSVANNYAVTGKVKQEGSFDYSEGMTLLKAISMAGGFAETRDYWGRLLEEADKEAVKIVRFDANQERTTIVVNAKDIMEGSTTDYPILPGDMVVVPKMEIADQASILGQVNRQGNYPLLPKMSVVRLISEAGGVTRLADMGRVRVTRVTADGSKTVFEVRVNEILAGKSPDVELEPGDVVYVPEIMF
ncbi:MAG: SLBB domain-containing protein [Candidatus Omnitrophica bacterium]|nr:SLBB domain-containing protein [Candidatus Omnitrophota bacterium]